MSNIFTTERVKKVRSNYFDLSHDVKLTTKFGRLTPILVQEVLPNDRFDIRTETVIRLAPMLAPVMHRINAYVHYFFVPNRILWSEWEDFITGGRDGQSNPPLPRLSSLSVEVPVSSLGDYLGLPAGDGVNELYSEDYHLLPVAAYYKIYHDYYKDQNVDSSEFIPLVSGADSSNNAYISLITEPPKQRAWRHDYFTSALPFAQRGDQVEIPFEINGYANVIYDTGVNVGSDSTVDLDNGGPVTANVENVNTGQSGGLNRLRADFSDADVGSSGNITELRRAIKLQEFFEKLARTGSRYFEVLRAFFGQRNLDARLDRAEYIGGQKQPIQVSEVLQTSEGTETSPQGQMSGHGISASMGKKNYYKCSEHGYIIGLLSVMPETAYSQGIPRHYSRLDRFDYYWPQFAHIGEQAIMNKELYNSDDAEERNGTFGYIPRYSEYRYTPSRYSGQYRDTLDYWHLGRKFDSTPNLNEDFIYLNDSSLTRIFAVDDGYDTPDYLWLHAYNSVKARRPIAKFGSPML